MADIQTGYVISAEDCGVCRFLARCMAEDRAKEAIALAQAGNEEGAGNYAKIAAQYGNLAIRIDQALHIMLDGERVL